MKPKKSGFTLIEVLIALMIFAFVAVMTSIGLRNITSSQTILSARNTTISDVQLAMSLMQQDLTQMVNRSATVNGEPQTSLLANAGAISFTTANNPNIGGAFAHSDLFRVKYFTNNQGLVRQINLFVDATNKSQPINEVILPGATDLSFKFINSTGQILSYWYSQITNSLMQPNPNPLPQGVVVDITVKGIGEIQRVFQTGGSYIASL
jgi:general secretion pathway protein J